MEVKVNGKDTLFAPEEISAMVLTKMKEVAEAYLGKTVSSLLVLSQWPGDWSCLTH